MHLLGNHGHPRGCANAWCGFAQGESLDTHMHRNAHRPPSIGTSLRHRSPHPNAHTSAPGFLGWACVRESAAQHQGRLAWCQAFRTAWDSPPELRGQCRRACPLMAAVRRGAGCVGIRGALV